MLRGFFLIFALVGIALVAMLGFRGHIHRSEPWEIFPDMVRQPKVRPQAPLGFFSDDRGMRVPVAGTVPIGYDIPTADPEAKPGTPAAASTNPQPQPIAFSATTDYYNTGRMGTNWGTGIPLAVTPQLMQRGAQRFNINCAVCHGPTAAGNGIAKQYGLTTVVSLQDERIRNMSDGEIFNTITHGKNTMMSYGPNVTVQDRWAIISYLRALQRSQNATVADVPPEARVELDKP
ncbi:MAG: cytochrome c [Verrucomicrobiota bacterium]|nr:cytochrome c [Verrucomicrobiota bacterium]